jgi:hypothetical protein
MMIKFLYESFAYQIRCLAGHDRRFAQVNTTPALATHTVAISAILAAILAALIGILTIVGRMILPE